MACNCDDCLSYRASGSKQRNIPQTTATRSPFLKESAQKLSRRRSSAAADRVACDSCQRALLISSLSPFHFHCSTTVSVCLLCSLFSAGSTSFTMASSASRDWYTAAATNTPTYTAALSLSSTCSSSKLSVARQTSWTWLSKVKWAMLLGPPRSRLYWPHICAPHFLLLTLALRSRLWRPQRL